MSSEEQYPLITLSLTCFNAEGTIARAIQSMLDQDYPNTEIIIVNDCSTDNSIAVIEEKIKGIQKAKLINHVQNTGVGGALNTVIQHAQGDYITIFDDDDISLPHRVSTQYKTIKAYMDKTGVDTLACWGSGYKQYDNGYRAPFAAIGSEPIVPVGDDVISYQLYLPRKSGIFYGNGTPGCSMMVPKHVYKKVGLYDVAMRRTEDTDFALRLALAGGHFIGCKENVVIQTASVGSDKRPNIGYNSEIALIEKYKYIYANPKRAEYAKDWIKLRFHHFGKQRVHAIVALLSLFVKYPGWTFEQFWRSAPKRLIHEWKMARRKKVLS